MGLRFTQIGVILAVLLIAINPAAGKGKWYLPSMGDPDEGLYDYINKTTEDQVESTRTTDPKPRRKASEDKHFSQGDSLHDEELVYWPHFDIGPWNWELPDINIRWPDLPGYADDWPQSRYGYLPPWQTYPGDGTTITSFVCLTSNCPDVVDCEDEFVVWRNPIGGGEILLGYGAVGKPVFGVVLDNDGNIVVYVRDNATTGQFFTIWYEKAFADNPSNSIICKTRVLYECGCECQEAEPAVYVQSGNTSMPRNDSEAMYVDSDELACPPFTWSVTGTGFSFSKSQTDSDLEINYLQTDNTACGVATITVTDDCGVTYTTYYHCDQGHWNSIQTDGCRVCVTDATCWAYEGPYRYRLQVCKDASYILVQGGCAYGSSGCVGQAYYDEREWEGPSMCKMNLECCRVNFNPGEPCYMFEENPVDGQCYTDGGNHQEYNIDEWQKWEWICP